MLSFWEIVKPMVAALGADLVFAAVFILYEVINAKPDLAEYVQYRRVLSPAVFDRQPMVYLE